jgi:hypothetical protein
MQLEILKQVQNHNYQGFMHKNVILNSFQHLLIFVRLYRTNCILELIVSCFEKEKTSWTEEDALSERFEA